MQAPTRHDLTRPVRCLLTGGTCPSGAALVAQLQRACRQMRRIAGTVPEMSGSLLSDTCPHLPGCRIDWRVEGGGVTLLHGDRVLAGAQLAPMAVQ